MNKLCIVKGHEWEQIGPIANLYSGMAIGQYSLNQCTRCGKIKLKSHNTGELVRWYTPEELKAVMTKQAYIEQYSPKED